MSKFMFANNNPMMDRSSFHRIYEGTAFKDSKRTLLLYIETLWFHKSNGSITPW